MSNFERFIKIKYFYFYIFIKLLDDPNHWCYKGKQFFYEKWHCSDETYLDTGIKLDPATNNVECLSIDGANCVWNNEDACKNPSSL